MRNRFVAVPDEDEQASKPTIKELAKAGNFALDFFHSCKVWYEALKLYDTNIWAPPYVVEATKEAWQNDDEIVDDPVAKWVMDTFVACSGTQAVDAKDVREAYRKKFGGQLKDASTKLREIGFILDASTGT